MSMLLGLVAGMGFGAVAQVPLEILQYELNAVAKHKPFDPATLTAALKRKEIDEATFLREFNKNGFTDEKATQFYNLTMSTQGIMEVITRFRRGLITVEQAEEEAEFINYLPEQFHKIEEATRVIFTTQDLIKFLVREVFTPEIRTRFKQDDEFPEAAIEQAAKIGMDEKTLKDYWAAHWELPSIQQGYEMYFRFRPEDRKQWEKEVEEIGLDPNDMETTLEDLTTLQRTQDLMPFWRGKQLGIAFRPLTIRMLRQQVRLRIMNYETTIYQFKKMGFSNKDAEVNTWFALIFESLTDWKEQLSKTQVTEQQIRDEMTAWKIPSNIQEDIWKRKLEPVLEDQLEDEKGLLKSEIKKRFMLDLDDREEALKLLGFMKYNEKTAKVIMELWELEKDGKRQKERELSKTDLFKSFHAGIRTKASLEKGLTDAGYSKEAARELILIDEEKTRSKESKT